MQRLDFHAMGCHMFAASDTPAGDSTEALAQVPDWFADWEKHLSRFMADSELEEINRAHDKPVTVGETMAQVLQASLAAATKSAGLVTPTVLDALRAAGYDKSFEFLRGEDSPAKSSPVLDWRSIRFDPATRTLHMPKEMRLDFGGIAKGWAADQAVGRLAPFGPALVDAGGDIAVSGPMANGEPWLIGIADPFDPERDLAQLSLERGAVATSGRDYRRWERNGKRLHHIIDPRTGEPAQTDVLCATTVAPSAAEAEVAAKVALIRGSEQGLAWLAARGLAGLLVLEDGRTLQTPSMGERLVQATENMEADFTRSYLGGTYVTTAN